jgi:hypothetical protein
MFVGKNPDKLGTVYRSLTCLGRQRPQCFARRVSLIRSTASPFLTFSAHAWKCGIRESRFFPTASAKPPVQASAAPVPVAEPLSPTCQPPPEVNTCRPRSSVRFSIWGSRKATPSLPYLMNYGISVFGAERRKGMLPM